MSGVAPSILQELEDLTQIAKPEPFITVSLGPAAKHHERAIIQQQEPVIAPQGGVAQVGAAAASIPHVADE